MKGSMAAQAGILALVLVAVGAIFLVMSQIKRPISASDYTRQVAKQLSTEPISFSDSRIIGFGCDTQVVPTCSVQLDVHNWDEYQVVAENFFAALRAAGYDPCKLTLLVGVTDTSLWDSYDPNKNPQAQCGG